MIYKIFQGGGMKRLLPFIPIIIFVFLGSSCEPLSDDRIKNAVASQLAASVTPEARSVAISTLTPELSNMVTAINTDLSTTSPLGWIMDVQYYVIDVTFETIPRKTDWTALVHVDCVCMNNTNCCVPERTFVVVIESMRKNRDHVPLLAFEGVGEFRVICSDLKTKDDIGTMSAPWNEVQAYILDRSMDPPSKQPLRGHAVRLEK
jgi:hypothetical protein